MHARASRRGEARGAAPESMLVDAAFALFAYAAPRRAGSGRWNTSPPASTCANGVLMLSARAGFSLWDQGRRGVYSRHTTRNTRWSWPCNKGKCCCCCYIVRTCWLLLFDCGPWYITWPPRTRTRHKPHTDHCGARGCASRHVAGSRPPGSVYCTPGTRLATCGALACSVLQRRNASEVRAI